MLIFAELRDYSGGPELKLVNAILKNNIKMQNSPQFQVFIQKLEERGKTNDPESQILLNSIYIVKNFISKFMLF
jgi:hypothetical protein